AVCDGDVVRGADVEGDPDVVRLKSDIVERRSVSGVPDQVAAACRSGGRGVRPACERSILYGDVVGRDLDGTRFGASGRARLLDDRLSTYAPDRYALCYIQLASMNPRPRPDQDLIARLGVDECSRNAVVAARAVDRDGG